MISANNIDAVVAAVNAAGLSDTTVSVLRRHFDGIHFTYCMDDEVCGPEPVRTANGFKVYLVDGRDHCLKFTNEPDNASGLVLAETDPEE